MCSRAKATIRSNQARSTHVVVGLWGERHDDHAGEDFFANLMDAWENAWPRPRVIVMSFPHNPTTTCVDLAWLERIVAFAREHDVILVHDFAYSDTAFDGYQPPSILQVPGAKDVAVELYTLTKSFSMAGWRVGFCSATGRSSRPWPSSSRTSTTGLSSPSRSPPSRTTW